MRFQKYALPLSSKTHRLIRVHTTVLMRFQAVHTKTWEKDRIAHYDVSGPLCACLKCTPLRYFRTPYSLWCVFDPFRPSTRIRYVCVFIFIHFQEHFRIDAFSMKTLIVWVWMEGLNESKCIRFQMKTHYCGRGSKFNEDCKICNSYDDGCSAVETCL